MALVHCTPHNRPMSAIPSALDPGVLLHGRFLLGHVLGRGGFAITYLATDSERGDACVVKELAPPGAVREADGGLSFAAIGPAAAQRLRHQFTQEAEFMSRLRARGIIPIREAWQERGTAYFATDYVADSMTLQKVLLSEGRMDEQAVLDIVYQLLETLERVHARGLLHRDIKPSNILMGPTGEVFLIDFGSAREWHSDLAAQHTIQHTPGYAPLEQLTEKGRRGPATDIYALCALAYALLTGEPPPPAPDRAEGIPLISLRAVRPDVEPRVARAIERGLAVSFQDRPQNIAALRTLLDPPGGDEPGRLRYLELDEAILKLQKFKYGRRECPGCGAVLDAPQPLKPGICPVCREGKLEMRKIAERLCPVCHTGVLHHLSNIDPLRICPLCESGLLVGQGLLKKSCYRCRSCGANFLPEAARWRHDEEVRTVDEWRAQSGHSEEVMRCDSCEAVFDREPDGRYRQSHPKPKPGAYARLYPEEWARVASGLLPGSGNAKCTACDADYFAEGEHLTLLDAHRDPYGFAERRLGQLLRRDDVRWLAVGKTSGLPGLVCVGGTGAPCGTEFDGTGDVLTLVRSTNPRLSARAGQSLTLANWVRLGQGLPPYGEEQALWTEMPNSIREAYESGELPFDSRDPSIQWRGPATRMEVGEDHALRSGEGQLQIDATGLTFGGLLRKVRVPIEEVATYAIDDGLLRVERSDGSALHFDIEPVTFSVKLESGKWETTLEAESLVTRLNGSSKEPG